MRFAHQCRIYTVGLAWGAKVGDNGCMGKNTWLTNASPEVRSEFARKGGLASSADRSRMSEIGKKGSAAMIAKYGPERMREIGRKGGLTNQGRKRAASAASGDDDGPKDAA